MMQHSQQERRTAVPVIRLYGFGNGPDIASDLREFSAKFRQAVDDGKIPRELANEVTLVPVDSDSINVMSEERCPYTEIYGDSETADTDLIIIARFLREHPVVSLQPLDIEIVWSNGKRKYIATGSDIPDFPPAPDQ